MKYGIRKIFVVGDLDVELKGVWVEHGLPLLPKEGYDLAIIHDELSDVQWLQNLDCKWIIAQNPEHKLEMPPFLLGRPIKTLNEVGLWNLEYSRKTTNNWTGVGTLWNPVSL